MKISLRRLSWRCGMMIWQLGAPAGKSASFVSGMGPPRMQNGPDDLADCLGLLGQLL